MGGLELDLGLGRVGQVQGHQAPDLQQQCRQPFLQPYHTLHHLSRHGVTIFMSCEGHTKAQEVEKMGIICSCVRCTSGRCCLDMMLTHAVQLAAREHKGSHACGQR